MDKTIYHADLTNDERSRLLDLIEGGEHSARKLNRAWILLLADDGKTDREIADALPISVPTVQRTRKRFVEANSEIATWEAERNERKATVDWQATTADARVKLECYPVIS